VWALLISYVHPQDGKLDPTQPIRIPGIVTEEEQREKEVSAPPRSPFGWAIVRI
jgi:hypothetical protein